MSGKALTGQTCWTSEMVCGPNPNLHAFTTQGMTMKCPTCTDTHLVMAERQGVEIDYCPACRGIWLDRGELDKLLDRAAAPAPAAAMPQAAPATKRPHGDQDENDDGRSYGYGSYGHGDKAQYKRKKSWLHEIFD